MHPDRPLMLFFLSKSKPLRWVLILENTPTRPVILSLAKDLGGEQSVKFCLSPCLPRIPVV